MAAPILPQHAAGRHPCLRFAGTGEAVGEHLIENAAGQPVRRDKGRVVDGQLPAGRVPVRRLRRPVGKAAKRPRPPRRVQLEPVPVKRGNGGRVPHVPPLPVRPLHSGPEHGRADRGEFLRLFHVLGRLPYAEAGAGTAPFPGKKYAEKDRSSRRLRAEGGTVAFIAGVKQSLQRRHHGGSFMVYRQDGRGLRAAKCGRGKHGRKRRFPGTDRSFLLLCYYGIFPPGNQVHGRRKSWELRKGRKGSKCGESHAFRPTSRGRKGRRVMFPAIRSAVFPAVPRHRRTGGGF